MAHISPTFVSIYDILYTDTQPSIPLLADLAQLSLPQTRLALTASIQAFVSALVAYEKAHGGDAVIKRLLTRSAIKEMRQYNAMNLATMTAAYRQPLSVTESLFNNNTSGSKGLSEACQHIATQVHADPKRLEVLMCVTTIIALRELAILADYAQLDSSEVSQWLQLQPQFLAQSRYDAIENENENIAPDADAGSTDDDDTDGKAQAQVQNQQHADDSGVTPQGVSDIHALPRFDAHWYALLGFTPAAATSATGGNDNTPHYAKVIGRTADSGNANSNPQEHMLIFSSLDGIHLPYQRWLLQLAEISKLYLERQRLKIAPEPKNPPSRPLVSLGIMGNQDNTPATASETPIEYDKPAPLWKNPVILLIIAVIGGLGLLAMLKFNSQQNTAAQNAADTQARIEADANEPQDIAIVRVDDESADAEAADANGDSDDESDETDNSSAH